VRYPRTEYDQVDKPIYISRPSLELNTEQSCKETENRNETTFPNSILAQATTGSIKAMMFSPKAWTDSSA
jgi:hypothetical protein